MNPYFLAGTITAVVLAYGVGHWRGDDAGQAKINAKWDKERAEQMAAFAKAQQESREKEQSLQTNADKLRREKDAEIRNANARAAALANSLRDRTDRPTTESRGLSQSADARSSAAGCTGAGLYRSDGEFLAREAAAGRQCQAFLRECRAAYDKLMAH